MPRAHATDHSQRFAHKTTEASISYANAGFYAGLSVFNVMCDAWSDAWQEAVSPTSRPKSWFRAPAKSSTSDPWSYWTAPMTAWSDTSSGQNQLIQAWFTPWWTPANISAATPWAAFLPTSANKPDLSFTRLPFWTTATAALPMTWSLMSVGVPYAVAKPAAEGNAAALEAFDSAQQFANDQIEAYKTAMEPPTKKVSSETVFDPEFAFSLLFWPWLSLPSETRSSKAA